MTPRTPDSRPGTTTAEKAPHLQPATRVRTLAAHPLAPFVLIAAAYVVVRIAAAWHLDPVILGDSDTYRPTTPPPPHPVLSFTGGAPRSWVVPAFYAVFPSDQARVAAQVAVSIGAWISLASVLAASIRSRIAQHVAFVAVLLLGTTPQVTGWDQAIISESLSLSLAVFSVAAWIRVATHPSRLPAILAVSATALWVISRPFQYTLALGLAAVCAAWALRGDHRSLKVGLTAALLVVAAWSAIVSPRINDGYRARDGYGVSYFQEAFGQNFYKRYLGDPTAEAWFRARGMPAWEGMSAPSPWTGTTHDDYEDWHVFFAELRERPDWLRWLDEQAQGEIIRYTLEHPGPVLRDFVDEVPVMLTSDWSTLYGRQVGVLPGPVDRLWFWGSTTSIVRTDAFAWAVLALAMGAAVALRRRRPSWPLIVTGALVIAAASAFLFQVWLGSAYEIARHAVPMTHLLRIGLLVVAVGLLDALISPSASATEPPTDQRAGGREQPAPVASGAPAGTVGPMP